MAICKSICYCTLSGSGKGSWQCREATLRNIARIEITDSSTPTKFQPCICNLLSRTANARNAVLNVEQYRHQFASGERPAADVCSVLSSTAWGREFCGVKNKPVATRGNNSFDSCSATSSSHFIAFLLIMWSWLFINCVKSTLQKLSRGWEEHPSGFFRTADTSFWSTHCISYYTLMCPILNSIDHPRLSPRTIQYYSRLDTFSYNTYDSPAVRVEARMLYAFELCRRYCSHVAISG